MTKSEVIEGLKKLAPYYSVVEAAITFLEQEIMGEEDFIEKGAELEHSRWAGWQEHLHFLCIKNPDSSLTIPKERVERWERQIKTKYADLPEEEKEFDRIEVRKYLPLIDHITKPLPPEQKSELP